MTIRQKKIMIIAGEASGDLHAANLVKALKEADGTIDVFGVGGERMQDAGVELIHDLAELAVIGLVEIVKNYRRLKAVFDHLVKLIDERRPDVLVLVDFPGFNLKFAKQARQKGVSILYYISPQVWAWGSGRIRKITRLVDKMVVILKFEEQVYRDTSLDVSYVGHPILDVLPEKMDRQVSRNGLGLSDSELVIGMLPGSRDDELRRIFPIIAKAALLIQQDVPGVRFFIPVAGKRRALIEELYTRIDPQRKLSLQMVTQDHRYELMNAADMLLVASGTVTVEAAYFTAPMAIVYKVNMLTALVARMVIKLPYVGLVNVIAGHTLIPEFLQYDANPRRIASQVVTMLNDRECLERIRTELKTVKALLGERGASVRAARIVLNFLTRECTGT